MEVVMCIFTDECNGATDCGSCIFIFSDETSDLVFSIDETGD